MVAPFEAPSLSASWCVHCQIIPFEHWIPCNFERATGSLIDSPPCGDVPQIDGLMLGALILPNASAVHFQGLSEQVGDRLWFIVPNLYVAVNLHNTIPGVRDGRLEEVWQVEAHEKDK